MDLLKFAKIDMESKTDNKPKSKLESKTDTLKDKAFACVPEEWRAILDTEDLDDIFNRLSGKRFTPPIKNVFEFAKLTDLSKIKVVIIGQDPYPRAGDAHGLAFSCLTNVPASLKNIFKCLVHHKLIDEVPTDGNLDFWAKQGVLLINRSLTTLIGQPNAHSDLWENYTTNLVSKLSKLRPLIFMLWGNNARELVPYIDENSIIYEWSHPSPLAQSKQKFIECPHFTDANKALIKLGMEPIDWNISEPQSDIEVSFGFNPKMQVAFTDGSCYPNKASPQSTGGYAAAFVLGTFKDVVLYGNIDRSVEYATNQRAEGTAILRVLEYLSERPDEWEQCVIVSDSEFWIKMFEAYMPMWARTNKFDEKKNPDLTKKLWEKYCELTEDLMKSVQFKHMKSHGKDGWESYEEGTYERFCFDQNKYVDELASYARTELKPGQDIVATAQYD